MNVYLTEKLAETKKLVNAKFLYIKDKLSFIEDCGRQHIKETGVKEEGIFYYWNGREWSKIDIEDTTSFKEMIKMGYENTPNIYISDNYKILATTYEDNIEEESFLYKILNQGENRGLFKKNYKGKWKRKMTPEETFILCQINERAKGNICKEILKDIIKNKY